MHRNAELPTERLCTGVSKYVQRGMFVEITCCNTPQFKLKGGMSTTNQLALPLSSPALP